MSLDTADAGPVLEVEDLRTVFHTNDGTVHAVNGMPLTDMEGAMSAFQWTPLSAPLRTVAAESCALGIAATTYHRSSSAIF